MQSPTMPRNDVIAAALRQAHRLRRDAVRSAGRWLIDTLRRAFTRQGA